MSLNLWGFQFLSASPVIVRSLAPSYRELLEYLSLEAALLNILLLIHNGERSGICSRTNVSRGRLWLSWIFFKGRLGDWRVKVLTLSLCHPRLMFSADFFPPKHVYMRMTFGWYFCNRIKFPGTFNVAGICTYVWFILNCSWPTCWCLMTAEENEVLYFV